MYPSELKYTKNHEYLKVLDGGEALVGITAYAQEALGDVVFVDLPETGTCFEEGGEFGTVESVKTVSEIFMPTPCEVLEINAELEAHPEHVNEDPYGKGWMVRVKLNGPLGAELLDAAAYAELVSAESH